MPDDYDGEIDEPVKIYSNIENTITLFGTVLHNLKSRGMYQLMSNNPTKEYYLKEMAVIIEKEENPRLPIYEHHIGIMVNSGIVKVRIKMHNKHKTKYYRIPPVVMIISPVHYHKAVKSKTLRNTFRQVFKLGAIGVAGIATWFTSVFVNPLEEFSRGTPKFLTFSLIETKIPIPSEGLFPIVTTTIVTSIGLIMFLYIYFRKKIKKN